MSDQPAPRDINAELQAMLQYAPQFAAAQAKAQTDANRTMMRDAQSATETIAGRLGDTSFLDYESAMKGAVSALSEKMLKVDGRWVATHKFVKGYNDGKYSLDQLDPSVRSKLEAAAGPKPTNTYTDRANAALDGALGQVPEMDALAGRTDALGKRAEDSLAGTEIERMLGEQAVSELGLGRELTPEQVRQAEQQARSGMAARGMAVGSPSAVMEVLNRDAYGSAREQQRRGFAGDVNQMLVGNEQTRIGTAANLLGQTAGIRQNTAQLGMAGAQAYVGLDPYQRAMGSSIPIASQGPSASMTSSAFGSMMGYGSDLYSSNHNAQWAGYLGDQNASLAQSLGSQQIGASQAAARQAANGQMTGALIGAGATVAAAGIVAF